MNKTIFAVLVVNANLEDKKKDLYIINKDGESKQNYYIVPGTKEYFNANDKEELGSITIDTDFYQQHKTQLLPTIALGVINELSNSYDGFTYRILNKRGLKGHFVNGYPANDRSIYYSLYNSCMADILDHAHNTDENNFIVSSCKKHYERAINGNKYFVQAVLDSQSTSENVQQDAILQDASANILNKIQHADILPVTSTIVKKEINMKKEIVEKPSTLLSANEANLLTKTSNGALLSEVFGKIESAAKRGFFTVEIDTLNLTPRIMSILDSLQYTVTLGNTAKGKSTVSWENPDTI